MACIGTECRAWARWLLRVLVPVVLLAGTLAAEQVTGKALLRRADGLINAGRPPEAEALLTEAIAQGEGGVELLLRLGISQSLQQKYDESEATFRQALKLNPREPRVLHNLGMLFLNQHRYDEALDYFHQTLKVRSWHPQSNFYIGVIHERRGEREKAMEYYIRELNVNPANPSAWRQYIQLQDDRRNLQDRGIPWGILAVWLVVVAVSGTLFWLKKTYWDIEESPGFAPEPEALRPRGSKTSPTGGSGTSFE